MGRHERGPAAARGVADAGAGRGCAVGLRTEHCAACHQTFTGTTSGDRHRVGAFWPDERRCLTPEEMRAKGMEQNARGHWTNGGTSPWAT